MCGDHSALYTHIKSFCCIPEMFAMFYVNDITIRWGEPDQTGFTSLNIAIIRQVKASQVSESGEDLRPSPPVCCYMSLKKLLNSDSLDFISILRKSAQPHLHMGFLGSPNEIINVKAIRKPKRYEFLIVAESLYNISAWLFLCAPAALGGRSQV